MDAKTHVMNWPNTILQKSPPDTRGHIGPFIDGDPVAVLGCDCDYCFREVVNMHERRGRF